MIDRDALTAYARECLSPVANASKMEEKYRFRNRYTHTLRVVRWCERLLEGIPADGEAVLAAAALHDIGYAVSADGHAAHGAVMAEAFLRERGCGEAFTANVADLIAHHSDKHLPAEKMSNELIVLQDADCLDEIGALTVLWDGMAEGSREAPSYESAFRRIEESCLRLTSRNRSLKSELGQSLYLGRLEVLRRFIDEARYELFL